MKYEEIRKRQLKKGAEKYGDNNINSRRTVEELRIDALEEVVDCVEYLSALEDRINRKDICKKIRMVLLGVFEEIAELQ